MTQEIGQALQDFAKRVGTTNIQRWRLGRGDGLGTVRNTADPNPRAVWIWRDSTEGREIGTAILGPNVNIVYSNIALLENSEVLVGYPPTSAIRHVLGLSDLSGLYSTGGLTPTEMATAAAAVPLSGNLANMRVDPSSYTSPGFVVSCTGFWYVKPSTRAKLYQGATTFDLTATAGAIASGKHRYGWMYYDLELGAWAYTGSGDLSPTGTLPSRSEFTSTQFNTLSVSYNAKRVVPVYLYYGQTGVAEADFYRAYDGRLEFPINSEDPAANRVYLYQWFI